jgi:hypothetical protein
MKKYIYKTWEIIKQISAYCWEKIQKIAKKFFRILFFSFHFVIKIDFFTIAIYLNNYFFK